MLISLPNGSYGFGKYWLIFVQWSFSFNGITIDRITLIYLSLFIDPAIK